MRSHAADIFYAVLRVLFSLIGLMRESTGLCMPLRPEVEAGLEHQGRDLASGPGPSWGAATRQDSQGSPRLV